MFGGEFGSQIEQVAAGFAGLHLLLRFGGQADVFQGDVGPFGQIAHGFKEVADVLGLLDECDRVAPFLAGMAVPPPATFVILEEMKKAIEKPRNSMSIYAPRIVALQINPEKFPRSSVPEER